MRKIFLLTFFVILIAFSSYANDAKKTDDFMYNDLLKSRLSQPSTKTYLLYLKEQINKMQTMSDDKISEVKTDAFWENRVKKIPEKYWEYYIPSLFTNTAVPQTFLNRPEIKMYKDRLPTNIAPEVEEVVKKYGKNISPDYYYLLMPETYARFHKDIRADRKTVKNNITEEFKIYADKSIENADKTAVSEYIQDKMALIDQNMDFIMGKLNNVRSDKITKDSIISNADVRDFIKSVRDIRSLIESETNSSRMANVKTVRASGEDMCSFFEHRVSDAGLSDDVKSVMKKHGFDDVSWHNSCQRIFKVSAALNLDLKKAQNIHIYGRLAKMMKKDVTGYKVNLDDFKALYPYQNLLYSTLKNDKYFIDHNKTGESRGKK